MKKFSKQPFQRSWPATRTHKYTPKTHKLDAKLGNQNGKIESVPLTD